MTEDRSPVVSKEEEKEKAPDFDTVLSLMISCFVESGVGIGVTLNIKGLIISGVLISREEYFKGIIQQIKNSNGDSKIDNAIADGFSHMDKIFKEKSSEKEQKPLPYFVHLKDARYFPGGNCTPSNMGVWWRGRLSEVDGFHIGNLVSETR